ncbi:DUF1249 domain-containing protein [Marichromatium bheemlicum]|uniref:DUF1249 domain-containing protein n=2 Tax=Marichromatium bheemlicum TaxID=365339 RepID=A0ABX1I4B2_9GAMM|nr:DUF1249 domain-containing protein [Marichromatium bheemlicum]NKN32222.1 DUF1249 domain-containing protein [Marichromatium bheemlicum]
MQPCAYPWTDSLPLVARPNVGALLALCEENFARLGRLAPDLTALSGRRCSRRQDGVDLVLEIESQTRYMTLLRLTYLFPVGETGVRADPDARLRAYHDARQLEVLTLEQSLWSMRNGYAPPTLAHKWRANLFLAKWLNYCLGQGHCFLLAQPPFPEPARPDRQQPTCP